MPSLLDSLEQQIPTYHPTDAEPKMIWDPETGRGYIEVGGEGGYSIELDPKGENKVYFGRD